MHDTLSTAAREDCASEARVLQEILARCLSRPLHLGGIEVDAASGTTSLAAVLKAQGVVERVERSDACVILLTSSVLLQPVCLLEVYLALRLGKPLIPILLAGFGYQFATAMATLIATIEKLAHDEEALAAVGCEDAEEMEAVLQGAIVNLIAISWEPHQGEHHLSAVAAEVVRRLGRAAETGRGVWHPLRVMGVCAGACKALVAGRARVNEEDGSFSRRLIGQGGPNEDRRSRGGRAIIGRVLLPSAKSEHVEMGTSSGGEGEHGASTRLAQHRASLDLQREHMRSMRSARSVVEHAAHEVL